MARTRTVFYNVRPRFSSGSPAMVSQGIAEQVVRDEEHALKAALAGAYGEEEQKRAAALGLVNVVTRLTERRGHWEVLDIVTGETYQQRDKYKSREIVEVFGATGWRRAKLVSDAGDGGIVVAHPVDSWLPPVAVRRRNTRLASSVKGGA